MKISPEEKDEDSKETYNINLFKLTQNGQCGKDLDDDFKVQLVVNNKLDTVLADTGAKVSVCSRKQAEKWGILERVTPSKIKIKPYKSPVIPTIGEARFLISFINLLNTNNCTKSCSQTNCLQAIITPCIRSEIDPASDSRFSVQAIGDFGGVLSCGICRY